MIDFNNKSDSHEKKIYFNKFRFAGIIVIGTVIGAMGTLFVKPPPSVKLLLNSQHNQDTINIITKLDMMEIDVLVIKSDILYIKEQIKQNTGQSIQ